MRRFPPLLQRAMLRKLAQLHAALWLEELGASRGNHLEKLRGNRNGQHSIRVNNQWRVCFTWVAGDVFDVTIVDYH